MRTSSFMGTRSLKIALVLLSSCTMAFGEEIQLSFLQTAPALHQKKNSNLSQQVIDWARQGTFLRGQLYTPNGQVASSVPLRLLDSTGKSRTAVTNVKGSFVFRDVPAGIYALQANATRPQLLRVWEQGTAPPAAKKQLLAVVDGHAVRGQCCDNAGMTIACDSCGECADCCGGACAGYPSIGVGRLLQGVLDNPWLVAAGTAAAIAIPLATDDDDERPGDDVDAVGSGEDAS